jgi:aminoglycoside phosphotransferase (APT) family kinase protein
MLSFVEGEPAFAPVPFSDAVVEGIGTLLRRAHDAQEGFAPAPLVVGHCDLYWTNVIFREGTPVALIDWELARPVTRTLEVAMAATYWAGVRIDELLEFRRDRIERGLFRGSAPLEVIVANYEWTLIHRDELATFLA